MFSTFLTHLTVESDDFYLGRLWLSRIIFQGVRLLTEMVKNGEEESYKDGGKQWI